MDDFSEKLQAAVRDRLGYIHSNREALLESWVAQHGYKPDECAIVQQDIGDGTIRVWVEKRGEFEELQRYRERERVLRQLLEQIAFESPEHTTRSTEVLAAVVRDFKISGTG